MTKISYMAGIGQDEYAQRAEGIKPAPFIPYLSLTKGEMQLALMKEQAQILAGFYGDPKFKQAEAMLDNALYRGVHGATPYMGAYDPALTGVVKAINAARRNTRPASSDGLPREGGYMRGIHIGEQVIPVEQRRFECLKAAGADIKKALECSRRFSIEKILNDGMENCGQYLAYGYLPKNNNLPQVANLKVYNQELAQSDISRVGKFDLALTQQWLNVGMMRKNAEVAKINPYGWVETNAILMALPEAGQKEVAQVLNSASSKWSANSQAAVGNQLAAIVRKYKAPGVGEPLTVTIAVITAITALIGAVSQFAKNIKAEKMDAFAQVNGFGARPFGPEEGDWDGDGIPNNEDTTPKGEGGLSTPLLIGGGLLAAYLLTK